MPQNPDSQLQPVTFLKTKSKFPEADDEVVDFVNEEDIQDQVTEPKINNGKPLILIGNFKKKMDAIKILQKPAG